MRKDRPRLTGVAVGLAMLASMGPARAAGSDVVIALSNSYYGNTWRHQMVDSFEGAAAQAKAQGLIGDYVILNGDSTVTQQMQQVSDLILKHVSAIAINAASLTALNGVIQKACDAGIRVVAFDSVASAPCATTLDWDFAGWQSAQVKWIADRIGRKGNMLIVRGVKGSAPDEQNYQQQMRFLHDYPDIKVVGTVYGMATGAVAQGAIAGALPSLPHIDAVLAQGGGEDFGIAQAFEQDGDAYKDRMPVIGGGGSAEFIHWWAEQRAKNGYSTISMNSPPSIGAVAFWIALGEARGRKVQQHMLMPFTTVTDDTLAQYRDLKAGTIVSPTFTSVWVDDTLLKGSPR